MARSKMIAATKGSGGRLLVFLHGWPDSGELWEPVAERLAAKHRCVLLTLPMFGKNVTEEDKTSWGFEIDELNDMLVEQLRAHMKDDKDKAVLVIHDWGSIIGFSVQDKYPELCSAIVACDVGPVLIEKVTVSKTLGLLVYGVLYQFWIMTGFALSRLSPFLFRRLGTSMSRALLSVFNTGGTLPKVENVHVDCGYPYVQLWKAYLLELFGIRKRRYIRQLTADEPPAVPTMYFWGAQKPFHFHTRGFLAAIEARSDCRSVAVDSAHWVMDGRAEEMAQQIDAFLDEVDLD